MSWALGFWEFLDKHADGLGFLLLLIVVVIAVTVASVSEDRARERLVDTLSRHDEDDSE